MVNSKGGFLVEDGKEVDEDLRAKERERERERAMQNTEPPIHLDSSLNPKCKECQTIDIDYTFRKVFGCLVCNRCKEKYAEKYSLLTKTECKEDYLLTDAELRDRELLPHLLKANPHKSTFANMMLFLRCQVEDFAWKKWGSPEALDAEWERRVEERRRRKIRSLRNPSEIYGGGPEKEFGNDEKTRNISMCSGPCTQPKTEGVNKFVMSVGSQSM
ncbi:XPA protein C-terminus-domain-containing protein [Scleroderma citrinum]